MMNIDAYARNEKEMGKEQMLKEKHKDRETG